jgi:hypothetical protein
VAAGVQLTGQLLHGVGVALGIIHKHLVGLGLVLRLLNDLLSLVLEGNIAVLDKVLVTLLGIRLCNNGFVLMAFASSMMV